MYSPWGGPLELHQDSGAEDNHSRNLDFDRASVKSLEETQQSWLLEPTTKKKKKQIDLGFMTCSRKLFLMFCCALLTAGVIVGLSILIWKVAPRHHHHPPPLDNYTIALKKALHFFDAQKSGKLPPSNNVSWRGTSGMNDGKKNAQGGPATDLTGGYYDAGDAIKFGFPGAFSMTLLSWSVIEYRSKYEAAGELVHVKEIIKWGTDYMLKTFNASNIQWIFAQVGVGNSSSPNDHSCWERPEDMDYPRPAIAITTATDLAAEMAAALAAASIVFKDNPLYSTKLVTGAKALYKYARSGGNRGRYSTSLPPGEAVFYNSTGYWDEFVWGGAWMYYATGNNTYLSLVTNQALADHAGARGGGPYYGVFDWDNKLIGAQLLLSRLRMLQGPPYPYEQVLKQYHNETNIVMCSYLPVFSTFNRTKGGLTLFNHGHPQPLQYAVNAAFLGGLYADYLDAADVPGWDCGPNFFLSSVLRNFSQSQVDYVLGKNPLSMSYLVGFGSKYPKEVHHRAASIPKNGVRYGCSAGFQWRDKKAPNPHVVEGAMVAGPDKHDQYDDKRTNYNQAEPTIAGNAGLVGALAALSTVTHSGVDANTIFAAIPPMFPSPPPPQAPWKP